MRLIFLALNILVVVIIFIKFNDINCNSSKKEVSTKSLEVIRTVTDTQYITVNKTIFKKGDTIFLDTTIYKEVPFIDSCDIDSSIIKYYAFNIYKDTINIDSSIVTITDTIQENRILGRSVNLNIKYPIVTNQIIYKEKNKAAIFIGGGLHTDKINETFNVGVIYKSPRNVMYGITYGIDSRKNIIYGFNLYKKL